MTSRNILAEIRELRLERREELAQIRRAIDEMHAENREARRHSDEVIERNREAFVEVRDEMRLNREAARRHEIAFTDVTRVLAELAEEVRAQTSAIFALIDRLEGGSAGPLPQAG